MSTEEVPMLYSRPCPIHPNWVDLSEALYDLTQFPWRRSALPEVKICEIKIHEPSSFLKHGNKLHSIRMRHFMNRLDSHRVASRTNRLPAWWIDNRGNDSCEFDQMDLNRQPFQSTLRNPPDVKIHEIKIHELSSFLKHSHKLQLIHTICVDSIELSQIRNIFNPPYIVQGRYIF